MVNKSSKVRLKLENGSELVVVRDGFEVVFDVGGDVTVYRDGDVVYPNSDINVPADVQPALEECVPVLDYDSMLLPKAGTDAASETGDVMSDGTIYAGISPTTGTKMYVVPEDAPDIMNWKDALIYAFNLEAYGYEGSRQTIAKNVKDANKDDGGWRLPTREELKLLYKNQNTGALAGTFNEDGYGYYWSSMEYRGNSTEHAWHHDFTDGNVSSEYKDQEFSVRCIRTEPRPAAC